MTDEHKHTSHPHHFEIAGYRIDAMTLLMLLVIPVLFACVLIGTKLAALQSNLLALGRVAEQTVMVDQPNEPHEVTIRIQNSTNETWHRDMDPHVSLVPSRPLNRTSPVYEATSWTDSGHIALEDESVAPGTIATFTFSIQAPTKDMYREYFVVQRSDGTIYPQTETVLNVIVAGTQHADALSSATWSVSGSALETLVGNLSEIDEAVLKPLYDYELVDVTSPINVEPNGTHEATITLRNIGNAIWYRDATVGDHPIRLGTARTNDRHSRFYDATTWLSVGRVAMTEAFVKPGDEATFTFTVLAPDANKAFREYFAPVVERTGWIDEGDPIYIDIGVGDSSTTDLAGVEHSQSDNPEKSIKVDLTSQTLQTIEDGVVTATYQVSTGRWSLPTPTGNFTVHNHADVAYSRRYNLYMDNWMAITQDGAYGIHSLPYWKLKNGGKYTEEAKHLGTPISHGCIRLSFENSKVVYDWAPNGTPVEIIGKTPH